MRTTNNPASPPCLSVSPCRTHSRVHRMFQDAPECSNHNQCPRAHANQTHRRHSIFLATWIPGCLASLKPAKPRHSIEKRRTNPPRHKNPHGATTPVFRAERTHLPKRQPPPPMLRKATTCCSFSNRILSAPVQNEPKTVLTPRCGSFVRCRGSSAPWVSVECSSSSHPRAPLGASLCRPACAESDGCPLRPLQTGRIARSRPP
jgi:hypothetical protein